MYSHVVLQVCHGGWQILRSATLVWQMLTSLSACSALVSAICSHLDQGKLLRFELSCDVMCFIGLLAEACIHAFAVARRQSMIRHLRTLEIQGVVHHARVCMHSHCAEGGSGQQGPRFVGHLLQVGMTQPAAVFRALAHQQGQWPIAHCNRCARGVACRQQD
jgi:hypothetical protein